MDGFGSTDPIDQIKGIISDFERDIVRVSTKIQSHEADIKREKHTLLEIENRVNAWKKILEKVEHT